MTDITLQVREALDTRDGSLLLHEDDLVLMRNRHSSVKAGVDESRGALLKIATLGMVGKNKLVLEYTQFLNTRIEDGNWWGEEDRAFVTEELQKAGITKRLHEKEGGEYTFFKLVEWMQVEILALFADSLNHTPWFRFPFYEVGMEYINMLKVECGVVEREFGSQRAFASMAFLTDAIPGVVMAFLFAQLSLLAVPLKLSQPANYDGFDKETFCEEVVCVGITSKGVEEVVGDRAHNVRSVVGREGEEVAVVFEVPPFKAMGEVLENIATKIRGARVIEISGLSFVQVRVSTEGGKQGGEQWFESGRAGPGVELIGKYQFTIDNTQPGVKGRIQLAFKVNVLGLLNFIRFVTGLHKEGVKLEQVYDFWG
jgi:hypothetical protein